MFAKKLLIIIVLVKFFTFHNQTTEALPIALSIVCEHSIELIGDRQWDIFLTCHGSSKPLMEANQ